MTRRLRRLEPSKISSLTPFAQIELAQATPLTAFDASEVRPFIPPGTAPPYCGPTPPRPRRGLRRDTLPDRPAVAGSECEAERPGEGQACCAVVDLVD